MLNQLELVPLIMTVIINIKNYKKFLPKYRWAIFSFIFVLELGNKKKDLKFYYPFAFSLILAYISTFRQINNFIFWNSKKICEE